MGKINQDFLNSLDLQDKEMERFIPFALQDLWELGSIPEYVYQLVENHVETKYLKRIVDFGCGKGAVLIYLAKRLKIQGLGVDMVPEFIESAKRRSIEKSVSAQLDFATGDILEYINKQEKYDILIYGYDSGLLGDVYTTISRLQNCIADPGYLILEIAFTPGNKEIIEGLPTEKELLAQLEKSSLKAIDKIFWDIDKIKAINHENNIHIKKRIEELKIAHPGQRQIFERYMSNQVNECKMIENDMICSTWIMKK